MSVQTPSLRMSALLVAKTVALVGAQALAGCGAKSPQALIDDKPQDKVARLMKSL